jgi:hypothetical protein
VVLPAADPAPTPREGTIRKQRHNQRDRRNLTDAGLLRC